LPWCYFLPSAGEIRSPADPGAVSTIISLPKLKLDRVNASLSAVLLAQAGLRVGVA